jgi:hypothetical protein
MCSSRRRRFRHQGPATNLEVLWFESWGCKKSDVGAAHSKISALKAAHGG